MFERFTERSRNVVVLAQEEAILLRHNYIGTEHLLLGLLREEDGVAFRVLESLEVTAEEVRAQIARIVGRGDEDVSGQVPFTPRTKKVLELALREALSLGHDYIGTEHLLLGLVRENEGVAARILRDFDADAERIRAEILRTIAAPPTLPGGAIRQVLIACPACGGRLETVTADRPSARFEVSAEGERTCGGCGRSWTISYAVSWRELSG